MTMRAHRDALWMVVLGELPSCAGNQHGERDQQAATTALFVAHYPGASWYLTMQPDCSSGSRSNLGTLWFVAIL